MVLEKQRNAFLGGGEFNWYMMDKEGFAISDSDIYTQVRRDTTSMNFHSPSYNPNVEKNEVLDKYPKFQRNLKDEFGFPQDGLINHPTYTKAEKARTITCLLHLEKNNFLTGYYYKKINVWGY